MPMAMRIFFNIKTAGCLFLLFLCLDSWAINSFSDPSVFNPSIANRVEIFEDVDDAYSVESVAENAEGVQFKLWQGSPSALELGHSSSAFWLKIVLHNDEDKIVSRLLKIANSHLAYVSFYERMGDGGFRLIATGNLEKFNTRPLSTRYFVFPVSIDPRSSTRVFVKVKSNTQLLIPVSVWDVGDFQHHAKLDYIFQSFYFGVVVAMAIFSLFYYFAIRDALYLKYLGLLLLVSFTVYSLNGLIKEFVPYDSQAWSQHSAAFGAAFSVGFLLNFMRHFLDIKNLMPAVDRAIKYCSFIYPLPMLLVSLYPQRINIISGQILTLVVIISTMLFGLYLSFKKVRAAHFFVFGYCVPFVVLFVNLLSSVKIIPQFWDVAGSTQSAFLVEMLVFSLALIDRTYQMRRQNEISNNMIISLQNEVMKGLREKESRLEGVIEKRYKELRHLIDMLSHEIRTPMSIVRMFVDMESRGAQSKKNAIAAIQDIDSIVERCIEADQFESGSVVLALEYANITSIIGEICQIRSDGNRVLINSAVVDLLYTDEMILFRVISNLIDNALKYSPYDSVVLVDVNDMTVESISGVQVIIKNRPDSAGFPDSTRIFEKYYRSRGAHSKTGSGLGLYLVKNFVELLNSKIAYLTEDNHVVFKLWIPR
jgi:signal transduction histidine kinase